jgi:hypothetical protein
MDDALRVGVRDRVARGPEGVDQAAERQPGRRRPEPLGRRRPVQVGDHVGQRPAADLLHQEVHPPVGERAEGVDGHDARMLELRGDLRLFDEARDRSPARGRAGLEDLQRHGPVERRIADPVDLAHRAAPEQPLIRPAGRGRRLGARRRLGDPRGRRLEARGRHGRDLALAGAGVVRDEGRLERARGARFGVFGLRRRFRSGHATSGASVAAPRLPA